MMDANAIQVRIGELCHQFRLPTMGAQSVSRFTAAGHGDALETLLEVLEQEAEDRRQRRIGRLRTASRLPVGKTWETFEHDRVPLALRQQLGELSDGSFVDRGVNVLAFGLPGTGKTHALCALGHRLVEAGRSVLFAPAYRLVQDLLAAKRDLAPPRQLRKLDNYDFLLLDDLGYLPQGRRRVRGALHPHRRTLRTPVPGHHVQPGLLPVGTHLRQPHGHGGGHRPGGPSLGHPGIRRAQLPHRSGPAAGSGTGGGPARIIDGTGK